jgi:protoporphyrinogen IX oxidase
MLLLILKALHVFFVVTWFSTLLYTPKLFRYQVEALDKPEPDRSVLIRQYKEMAGWLWNYIGWPSAVLCLFFGLGVMSPYFHSLWFWVKMVLVLILYIFHLVLHYHYLQLRKDRYRYTAAQYRALAEYSGIFLLSIVFLAVLKNAINPILIGFGLVTLILLLILGIRTYLKRRRREVSSGN